MASIQIGKTARAAAMPCGPPIAMAMRTGAEWVVNVRSGNCSTGMRFTLSMSPAEAAELGRLLLSLDCVKAEIKRRVLDGRTMWLDKWPAVKEYEEWRKSNPRPPEPAPVHYSREMREAVEYEAQVERVAADIADMYAEELKDAGIGGLSDKCATGIAAKARGLRVAHDHLVLTCGIKRPALQGEWACKCDRCVVLARGDFPPHP